MGYVLAFIGGSVIGVVTMCCFITSGQESRKEEKYFEDGQNQSDGV